jgi:hypothetical protein
MSKFQEYLEAAKENKKSLFGFKIRIGSLIKNPDSSKKFNPNKEYFIEANSVQEFIDKMNSICLKESGQEISEDMEKTIRNNLEKALRDYLRTKSLFN